jgi:uncharacterized protein (TIGR04255 family)
MVGAVTRRPPVNEVIISVSFKPQAVLEGPRLMVGLTGVLEELPKVDEVPPYTMAEELPFEDQALSPSLPQIQFVGIQQLQRRLWFTNPDSPELLLQAQSDYLALNWRRQDDGQSYPGFESLKAEFLRYMAIVSEACEQRGGNALEAKRAEITYINLLKPDSVWGNFGELDKVVTLALPQGRAVEQLNAAYSRTIEDEAGSFLWAPPYRCCHSVAAKGSRRSRTPPIDHSRPHANH